MSEALEDVLGPRWRLVGTSRASGAVLEVSCRLGRPLARLGRDTAGRWTGVRLVDAAGGRWWGLNLQTRRWAGPYPLDPSPRAPPRPYPEFVTGWGGHPGGL